VSPDTLLAGVQRALARTDDDRVLRRDVLERVRRTIPFDAFAWLLTDPETTVGTAPLAEVPCLDRLPRLVALRYTAARRWSAGVPGVVSRPVPPGSDLALFIADYGSYDVVTLVFADRFGWWGFLDLWREGGCFGPDELEVLGALGPAITTALRSSRAAAFLASGPPARQPLERSLLLLGSDLQLHRQTPEAEESLRALLPTEASRRPVPAAAYNVAAQLLAVEQGVDRHRPLVRTAVAPGSWVCLQAARLGADIGVTIGPLEQQERWTLFSRVHGLSQRETDVVGCLVEGDDSRAVAARLHLSRHTVQDHLKSVFAKVGVRSRRELLALARGA
jgi:DNA-binding CsgD family transcriptional regulator